MKRLLLCAILTFVLGASASADMKVALIDTGRAFDAYYKTRETATRIAMKEAKFKKEIADLKGEYQQSNRDAQNLETEVKDQSLPLDVRKGKDTALAQKVQDLSMMEKDLSSMSQQRTQEIRDDLVRSHKEISEQIVKVITDYASRLGYDLVLDSSLDSTSNLSHMPYHSVKVFDITDVIITKLNASAPVTPALPAPAPTTFATPPVTPAVATPPPANAGQ